MRLNKKMVRFLQRWAHAVEDIAEGLELLVADDPAAEARIDSGLITDKNGQARLTAPMTGTLVDVQVTLPANIEKTEFTSWAVDVLLNDKRMQSQVLNGTSRQTTLVLHEPVTPADSLRVQVSVNAEPVADAFISAAFEGNL